MDFFIRHKNLTQWDQKVISSETALILGVGGKGVPYYLTDYGFPCNIGAIWVFWLVFQKSEIKP